MTQIFDKNGNHIPVTVLEVGPCTILQVKKKETDGYPAIQLGFDAKKENKAYAAFHKELGLNIPLEILKLFGLEQATYNDLEELIMPSPLEVGVGVSHKDRPNKH